MNHYEIRNEFDIEICHVRAKNEKNALRRAAETCYRIQFCEKKKLTAHLITLK